MAEVLAGISVACNILDLVKYGQEAAAICRQVYKDGQDVQTFNLKETTEALREAITEWRAPPSTIRTRGLATTSQACLKVADELRHELDEISITGKKSLAKVLGTSLKSMRKAGHIQKLKGQLKEYEEVMNTQILLQLSKQISQLEHDQDQILSANMTQLQDMLQQLRNNDQSVIDSVKALRTDIAQHIQAEHTQSQNHNKKILKAGIRTLEKSNANEHMRTRHHTEKVIINRLRDYRISQDTAIQQQQILKSLVVTEMLERQESSRLSAHSLTCEWIFKPGAAREKGWDDFVEWLENGKSMYWISGKPGSGKSTLMSFLIHDGREKILSHILSGSSSPKCYVLSAFIFEGGTELGRNSLGLLRNLLWQLLEQDLDQGGSLFPLIRSASVSPGIADLVWTEARLLSSLRAIFSRTQATWVLFLDGLDEFEDELWLLEFLQEFEQIPNLRICVSSRPEIVLSSALQHKPKLRLQDLTQPAIETFIDERLIQPLCLDFQASANLRANMIERAEGVFLWVALVIKDLRSGHLKGASPEDLQRRLDDIPPGLFNLYTRMLERNSREMTIYRSEAEKYLRLICAAGPLTLLQVKIALERSLQDSFLLPGSTWDYAELCALNIEQLAVQIRARCAGFLEIQPTSSPFGEFLMTSLYDFDLADAESEVPSAARSLTEGLKIASSQSVQFIHRSVIEYLNSSDHGKPITEFGSVNLQDELENANRARLVSIIALSDVEFLASLRMDEDIVMTWLSALRSDRSTLSLALPAFNKILLGQGYEFQSELGLMTTSRNFQLFPRFGDSQYGANFLFWFPRVESTQAVTEFMKARGQSLDTYDRVCRQLLLSVTELSFTKIFDPPFEDLIMLILTTCIDLDSPHHLLFSPRTSVSIRERLFLRAVCPIEKDEVVTVVTRSEIVRGLENSMTVEPRFTEVCQRDGSSKLHFRYAIDNHVTRISTVHDLLTSEAFEFSLLWDSEESNWYDVSNADISGLLDILDETVLGLEYYWSGSPGTLRLDSADAEDLAEQLHQNLKTSGRKVECAQQMAQILQWPPLTTDELIDLEMILFSHEPVPDSDIIELQERMALRLQGLKPDPLVPVPEFIEWMVETYAPERYKPASRKE